MELYQWAPALVKRPARPAAQLGSWRQHSGGGGWRRFVPAEFHVLCITLLPCIRHVASAPVPILNFIDSIFSGVPLMPSGRICPRLWVPQRRAGVSSPLADSLRRFCLASGRLPVLLRRRQVNFQDRWDGVGGERGGPLRRHPGRSGGARVDEQGMPHWSSSAPPG